MQAREEEATISTAFAMNCSNCVRPKPDLLLRAGALDSNMGKEGAVKVGLSLTTCKGWTLCYVLAVVDSSSSSNNSIIIRTGCRSLMWLEIGDRWYLPLHLDLDPHSIYRD